MNSTLGAGSVSGMSAGGFPLSAAATPTTTRASTRGLVSAGAGHTPARWGQQQRQAGGGGGTPRLRTPRSRTARVASDATEADLVERYRPRARCGATAVTERAARALERAATLTKSPPPPPTPPRYQRRGGAPRTVQLTAGGVQLEKGDELTRSCQWRQESCDLIANVDADIKKLDAVIAAKDDKVYHRRTDAIVHTIARNDELRSTLGERVDIDMTADPLDERQKGTKGFELNTYIDDQLQKLAKLHPQGYTGILSRTAHLAKAKAVVDSGRRYRLDAIAAEADQLFVEVSKLPNRLAAIAADHAEGRPSAQPHSLRDANVHATNGLLDELDMTYEDFQAVINRPEGRIVTAPTANVGTQTGDGRGDSPGLHGIGGLSSVASSPSHAGGGGGQAAALALAGPGAGAITARHYLTSIHGLIASLGGFLRMYFREDSDGNDYLSDDAVTVHFVRSCRADFTALSLDLPKGSMFNILEEFKASALGTVASQATPTVFLSALGHLTHILSMITENTRGITFGQTAPTRQAIGGYT